eukprot:scaffold770_cov255-Pinguiococcus_pyrenoidosus.AAC.72
MHANEGSARCCPESAFFDPAAIGDDAWERSKENVVPLKRGRRVDALERSLAERDVPSHERDVEAKLRAFERQIREYVGQNPLQGWLEYIRFVQEEFPSDKQRAFLIYERCSKALKDIGTYRNDPQYIAVWLRYADCLSNPNELFKFLSKNRIGRECHLFWIGWAFFSEHSKNYALTDKIFQKAMHEVPEGPGRDKIAARQKQFQRRMSRLWLDKAAAEAGEAADIDDGELRPVGRDALKELGVSRRSRSSRQTQRAPSAATESNTSNRGFKVFVEEEFTAGTAENFGARVGSEDESHADVDFAAWHDFGTEYSRTKENREKPEAWNARGGLPTRSERDRSGRRRREPAPAPAPAPQPSFGDAHGAGIAIFEDEACKGDPVGVPQDLPVVAPDLPVVAPDLPVVATVQSSSVGVDPQKEEAPALRMGFDVDLLMDEEGSEQQFEEARAKGHSLRPQTPRNFLRTVEMKEATFALYEDNAAQPCEAATGGDDRLKDAQEEDKENQDPSDRRPSADACKFNAGKEAKKEADDMTINTKFALDELADVFCSPGRTFSNQRGVQASALKASALVDITSAMVGDALPVEEEVSGRLTFLGGTNASQATENVRDSNFICLGCSR